MKYYLGPWQQSRLDPPDELQPDGSIIPSEEEGELYWHAPAGTVGLIDLRSIPGVTQATYGFFCLPDHLSLDSSYDLLGQGHLAEINTDGEMMSTWTTLLGINETPESATLLDLLWDTLGVYADPSGSDRAKPILPRRNGTLELHLGGHSLVKSARFDKIPTRQRNVILDIERRDMERIRQDSRDGKLVNARSRRVDDTMHRQVLQSLVEKYGVPWEMLVPQGWDRRETPLRHDTTVSDDFNRADENLNGSTATVGGVSQGWQWALVAGGLWVAGNVCQIGGTNSTGRAEVDLSSADHYAQSQLLGSARFEGVITRFHGSDQTYYYGRRDGDLAELYSRVSGTFTEIGSASVSSLGIPHIARLVSDGSSQVLEMPNETTQISVTNTTVTANLRTGLRGSGGASGNRLDAFDNFLAGDLAAGGEFNPAWAINSNIVIQPGITV